MIAGEIGDGTRGQTEPIQPALIEPVRGGLEREMAHPRFGERPERLPQRGGIGGGEAWPRRHAGGLEAERAERGGAMAEPAPELAEETHRARLAIGAGDGDRHLRLTMPGQGSGGERIGPPRRRTHEEGDVPRSRGQDGLLWGENRDRAAGQRIRHEPPAIGAGSGKCCEHRPRGHGAAVGGDGAHFDLATAHQTERHVRGQRRGKVGELHSPSFAG